jgi:hypothetical protein
MLDSSWSNPGGISPNLAFPSLSVLSFSKEKPDHFTSIFSQSILLLDVNGFLSISLRNREIISMETRMPR